MPRKAPSVPGFGNVPAHAEVPTIPIAYLQLLVEILGDRGIARASLLSGLPIDAALLDRPDAKMSGVQWARLVLRALELTSDRGLGYEYGLRMRPTAHGLLGYAAMTCTTMRQAMELSVRYARVRQVHFEMELDTVSQRLILRERFPIPTLRAFFHENILVGVARGSAVLLGRDLEDFPDLEIWFDHPEPAHHEEWRTRLPRVRFSRAMNAVCFPPGYLELRPALADPSASRQAIALCERELALTGDGDDDLPARVQRELDRGARHGRYPQLDDVAARLSLSSRTLKRRLQEHGSSFRHMLEQSRQRDACALLAEGLSVQEVATRLGYENPANFSRAFASWTGAPPSRYRAQ